MDGIKILIIITLFAIVFSLGSALFHLSAAPAIRRRWLGADRSRRAVGCSLHSVNAGLVQRPHNPARRHALMGSGPVF
jgi:hypothetical protein